MDREFDLKLSSGKTVTWLGRSGIEAATRYASCFPGTVVIAWRWKTTGIGIGLGHIIEPGDPGWSILGR